MNNTKNSVSVEQKQCQGMCAINNECVGETSVYEIVSHKDGQRTFIGMRMRYCNTAFAIDRTNGFLLNRVGD